MVNETIAGILPHHARRRGGKAAVVTDGGDTLTYATLDDRCRRFAGFLRSRLVVPGERVAILLQNVPEFVIAYFGTIAAGCVAVPVNYRLSPAEVAYILSDCSASLVVTSGERFGEVAGQDGARGVRDWLLVDGGGEGSIPFDEALAADPVPAPEPAAPDDVAVLLYTSGTTGFPKGAMISHRNTLFNVDSCRATLGYREDDVGLLTLPLFHVTGLHSQLVALLACGATVVLQKEYDTGQVLERIARNRVTALFFVPAIYKLFTLRSDIGRYDLSSVRIAAYGGAPMAPETILALRGILPARLHNCYGLTECSSLGTVLPAELALSKSESVGFPVPGTEAEVRGAGGETIPPGEPGELHLRGPHIVRGYFGAPEKTREAIRDGWLRTGDVARIDADGLVYILDRTKDMINRGGEKVYGLEVENVLYVYPGVAEAAVFGISHPVFGEVPAACVVPLPGSNVDPEGLIVFCRGRLADYKVPVSVRVVDRIPRNPAGKVLKKELRREWETRSREGAR
ncbi:MAG: AMP-binding protein [Deltaproteobacteria bacterium]|nr:AMP-binding protein [Deltaproteobacteria bacterium]